MSTTMLRPDHNGIRLHTVLTRLLDAAHKLVTAENPTRFSGSNRPWLHSDTTYNPFSLAAIRAVVMETEVLPNSHPMIAMVLMDLVTPTPRHFHTALRNWYNHCSPRFEWSVYEHPHLTTPATSALAAYKRSFTWEYFMAHKCWNPSTPDFQKCWKEYFNHLRELASILKTFDL